MGTPAGDTLRKSRAWLVEEARQMLEDATKYDEVAALKRQRADSNTHEALQFAHAIRVLEGPNAPLDMPEPPPPSRDA